MDLGIFLSAPVPKPWTEGKEERIYAQELDLAVRADAAGFGYCWMSEHHFLYEYCHSSSPEMQLAAIAARTKDIRIGHAIVDLQQQINHPIRVAERVATLDLISNGRVEFGSGKGSGPNEWIGFDGVPMEQVGGQRGLGRGPELHPENMARGRIRGLGRQAHHDSGAARRRAASGAEAAPAPVDGVHQSRHVERGRGARASARSCSPMPGCGTSPTA